MVMNIGPQAVRSTGRLPTFFLPHGGGPCFFVPSMAPAWASLATFLRDLPATLETRPKAIVVISAHWEESRPTVTLRADPPLLFDYHGFPPETYALRYDVPGSPPVARRITELLSAAGIPASTDAVRGLDHGVFIPFMLVEPRAEIPIVELSLVAGLDATQHLAIGDALAPLRDEGVLLVGSGMSYHNMRGLMSGQAIGAATFDAWLSETAAAEPQARASRLQDWQSAPDARRAHPREEHLLPLMVAAGAAGNDRGTHIFCERINGAVISAFRFG
jgi:aromatic ring-opening dioxygenase catalytic subunit (LigB family)